MLKDTLMQSYAIPKKDENDVKLDEFYLEQINQKIEQLELALSSIDQNGHFDDNIKAVLNNCMQIMDLGMIHGYEGVEAIAETMFIAARYCAQKGSETLDEVRPKLMKALDALKEVVELTDPLATQDLIDRARNEMDYRIDDLLPAEEGENDELLSEPIRSKLLTASKKGDKLFEIKEDESESEKRLIPDPAENGTTPSLDEEAVAQDVDRWLAQEEAPAAQADRTDAFLEGEFRWLQDGLDPVSLERLHHILDTLEDNIGRAETGIELEEAIEEIQTSIRELSAVWLEDGFEFLQEILEPLARVASDYLENDWVRLEVIAAIREGTLLVREWLHKKKLPVSAISAYRKRLDEIENKAVNKADNEQEWLNEGFDSDDIEISEPPKLPFIVRLKKIFGMY